MRPATRRVVTDHDSSGKAIVRSDEDLPVNRIPDTDFANALLWTTTDVPADNVGDAEGSNRNVGVTLDGGTAFWTTDFGPGAETQFHRTQSIDYAVVISGAIQLELDSGEVRNLGPGDVVVQRGTNHLWRNISDQWCRVNFILVEALPVIINGETLGPTDMGDHRE